MSEAQEYGGDCGKHLMRQHMKHVYLSGEVHIYLGVNLSRGGARGRYKSSSLAASTGRLARVLRHGGATQVHRLRQIAACIHSNRPWGQLAAAWYLPQLEMFCDETGQEHRLMTSQRRRHSL